MKKVALLVIIVALIAFGIGILFQSGCNQQPTTQEKRESLYEKVLRTGKIQCSYAPYPPYCIKDPNTGSMSGIFVEVLEKIGEKLELDIEWAEEVGWGMIFEGLGSGRHDMFGAGLWQNSTRAKIGYFSKPLFYNGIRIWVRADETRIKTLEDINSPDIRLTAQDGAMDDIIARTDFPKAQIVSIPQLNPWSDNLLNTISGKADVSFSELGPISDFLEKNPGTLKEVQVGRPLRVFANSYVFRIGEDEFKAMIDAAIDELALDGTIERILRKYEKAPRELFRVTPPYQMP